VARLIRILVASVCSMGLSYSVCSPTYEVAHKAAQVEVKLHKMVGNEMKMARGAYNKYRPRWPRS
jgi:hypothetical protein